MHRLMEDFSTTAAEKLASLCVFVSSRHATELKLLLERERAGLPRSVILTRIYQKISFGWIGIVLGVS